MIVRGDRSDLKFVVGMLGFLLSTWQIRFHMCVAIPPSFAEREREREREGGRGGEGREGKGRGG